MKLKERLKASWLMPLYQFIRWRVLPIRPLLHRVLLTREDLNPDNRPVIVLDDKFSMRELDSGDLPQIHALRPDMSIERYGRMMERGKRCFGVFDGEKLVAKMWLNLDEFNSDFYRRTLKADEAYLFDAFSNPEYRGNNLAPALRIFCYQEARRLGRKQIYSITDYRNMAARRFKEKLNARHERLYVFVGVRPGRRGVSVLVWRYGEH